jgi:hypothetical protein
VSTYLDREDLLVCYGLDEADVDRLLRDTPLIGLDGRPVVEADRLGDLLGLRDREDHFDERDWEDYLQGCRVSAKGDDAPSVEDDPFGDLTPNPEGGGK